VRDKREGTWRVKYNFGAHVKGEGAHIHRHNGTVMVYTLSGRWKYHQCDWVVEAGDFVFEPSESAQSFTKSVARADFLAERRGFEPLCGAPAGLSGSSLPFLGGSSATSALCATTRSS
jgi:hypothetical protein